MSAKILTSTLSQAVVCQMIEGLDLAEPPPSPRSAKRKMMFITLAGMLAIVGTLAGAYYFAMRPVTLRIAVGPANSDDVKVVQALTQAFSQAHGHVRLRPVQTDGARRERQALADGKVDLAIIRGDLDVPKNAQAVATLRKNVAVLWVPPPSQGQEARKPARRSPRLRSSPDAASAWSAAPRPMSICSR